MYYDGLNRRPFSAICNNKYGRKIIYSNAPVIDETNIREELGKALSIHNQNKMEIEYLERYYKGDQPINYRVKEVRPDINNKVLENHAYEIVEHKTAENFAEPVQYVLRGTDEKKSASIKLLNNLNDSENKGLVDIEIGRWKSICGTAYKFHWVDANADIEMDEAPFGIACEDPRDCFVVYSSKSGHQPLFSCQIRKDEKNQEFYFIYTDKLTFEIKGSQIEIGINGIGVIPLVEYQNNDRRLSDIEIVIALLDKLNAIQSNRIDGIEQFVQAFMKFKNCEIDEKEFLKMCKLGAVSVKTPQGAAGDSDVELMTAELNQQQTQTVKDDIYDNVLTVEGMPSREQNTGGDTGQAVYLRNGWDFAEQRASLYEPLYKKSERQSIRIVLKILRNNELVDLKLSDIDIKVTRSKMDNMQVKAQALQMLLASGINPKIAVKTIGLFADPEETYMESKGYMDAKYMTADQMNAVNNATGQNLNKNEE